MTKRKPIVNTYSVGTKHDDKGQTIWEAYCPTCQTVIDSCANGSFAQCYAEQHTLATKHETIVGFRLLLRTATCISR